MSECKSGLNVPPYEYLDSALQGSMTREQLKAALVKGYGGALVLAQSSASPLSRKDAAAKYASSVVARFLYHRVLSVSN